MRAHVHNSIFVGMALLLLAAGCNTVQRARDIQNNPASLQPGERTVRVAELNRSTNAILTIEEAVKEAEFRDRDLLVFRSLANELFVLHRRRDGQMELAEIPL